MAMTITITMRMMRNQMNEGTSGENIQNGRMKMNINRLMNILKQAIN